MQIFSFQPFGYEGALVTVEADVRRGIPAIDLIGLADGAMKESRERMKSAIKNSGFEFPKERVLISLSPADLKKESAGFDLALALAVLEASNRNESNGIDLNPEPILVMGELELSGALHSVKAVHAAVSTAISAGIRKCIVPSSNVAEALEVTGMKVFGATNLRDAFEALSNPDSFISKENKESEKRFFKDVPDEIIDKVNYLCKKNPKQMRALTIALAGKHNLGFFGIPGCGKTLALQYASYLLPLLTVEEAQSVTRIHSLAGLLSPSEPLMHNPPFRMPHQTASIEGICGGGINCRPGEISLSHNGVLFLDEAAEFKSSVLQMLRVPLESGCITLSRAGRSTTYPARFQLLMAINPCPCGNFGSETKICLCSAKSVERYWRKFSAPLLDRIDILMQFIEEDSDKQIDCESMKNAIQNAFIIEREEGKYNAYLTPQEILERCFISDEMKQHLQEIAIKRNFSQRRFAIVLKLAKTIANMCNRKSIGKEDLNEAIELATLPNFVATMFD